MKLFKCLLPVALAVGGFATSLHAHLPGNANDYSTTIEERESDMEALRDFEKSKSQITIQEKGGNLMLSGDIRADWDYVHSRIKNVKQRGDGSSNLRFYSEKNSKGIKHAPFPTNAFNIEANVVLDYKADRTWGKIHLEFDNPAGIRERSESLPKHFDKRGDHDWKTNKKHKNLMFGSGRLSNIALRKAYAGYNVCDAGTQRFDVEIGRRRLYDTFDSKVQFNNFYDGITLKYDNAFEGMTDFKVNAAAFVVDQTTNYYAWIGEVGLLNMVDSGVDLKYSYINWDKSGVNRMDKHHPKGVRFNISQLALAYNLSPNLVHYKSQLYGAVLHNHVAKRSHFSSHKKADNAWYIGMRVGEVKRQNDWAIDLDYEWVQAQAIPESDVHGIGRDNPRAISFYRKKWGGFANYKGWKVDGLYAITDNLSLKALYQRVREQSHKIGGGHHSSMFELCTIYAF